MTTTINSKVLSKGTPKQIIQSALDDIDMFVRLCNMEELANEVNFLSDYLQHQLNREIITQNEYNNYKINLKEKIHKTKDNCECNIKGGISRISYVGPR